MTEPESPMSSDRAVTAGPRRRLWPRRGPVAMLGVVLALSLVMVAAAAAPARSQDDAPVEDSQDAPSEDAEAETPEEPPDAPAEDGPAANEPPDAPDEGVTDDEAGPLAPSTEGSQPFLAPGFVAVAAGWRPPVLDWPLALVPPVPQVDVPSLAALLGTDLAPCPPRPSSPFVDTDPYPGGWCREPSYWVVEVVCGPQHADAGVTVRFNADPGVVGPLTLDDVCGGADRVAACRAPEPEAPAAEDAAAAPPAAEDAGDVAHLRSAIDATSPADACAPLWPPGAWYQFTSRDPIGGSTTSGGGHTGSWLGSPPPAAAAGPSLGLRCPGRRLEAVVHTGGAFTGSHGWGIPVDYRIGGSLRFQEWAPLGAVAGSGPGVSLPPLFAADFAGLLAANPSGEFHFRLYGPDGAEFGTALFDLAAIREVVRPMREHCPALAAPLADAATVATAPAPEEG